MTKSYHNLILYTLFFTLLLLGYPQVALSAQSGRVERKIVKEEKNLEDVRKKLREGKESLEGLAVKENSILAELTRVNKRITSLRLALRRIRKDIKKSEKEISNTRKKLDILEKERNQLATRLKKRLRAIYMLQSGAAVKVIFSSVSTEEIGRRHKYLTIIMDSDLALINDVENNLNALNEVQARFEALKKTKEKRYLASKNKENASKKARNKRSRFLKRTRKEKKSQKRLIAELEIAAAGLTELIDKLKSEEIKPTTSSDFARQKGKLRRPVKGKILTSYGRVKHPRYKTITFNNGITINASVGTDIACTFDGKVAYVGWLKGYGQMMIVDHGNSFYTIYGHLLKVLKARGSEVKEGEVIALVGDSGTDGQAGLYFEVRERGVPRDPIGWLATK